MTRRWSSLDTTSGRRKFRKRHYVTIRPDVSADGDMVPDFGGPPWRVQVPMFIYDASGGETRRGSQIEAQITHIAESRFLPELKHTMRIEHRGRNLNIKKIVALDGIEREIEIHCVSVED